MPGCSDWDLQGSDSPRYTPPVQGSVDIVPPHLSPCGEAAHIMVPQLRSLQQPRQGEDGTKDAAVLGKGRQEERQQLEGDDGKR